MTTGRERKTALSALALPLVAAIVALGLFLRLHKLDTVPAGLYIDEASFGYNAYSILKTGADEFGTPFPLYTPSFGTGKNPVYLYAAALSAAALGLNEFSTRLPAAVFGALTILFSFMLGTAMTGRRSAGLLAALFLALCPWHFFFSRFAIETTSMSCFISLGFYLLFLGLKKPRALAAAAIVLGVALYTYAPAIPFIGVMLVAFAVIFSKQLAALPGRDIAVAAIAFALLAVPHFFPAIKGAEQAAHLKKSAVVNPDNDADSRALLRKSPWPAPLFADASPAPIRAAVIARNYISNYSPRYLFSRGDFSSFRARVKGYGPFLPIMAPLLALGLAALLLRPSPGSKFLLCWFFAFPLGASIATQEFPSATRTFTALPGMELIFAAGILAVVDAIKSISLKHKQYAPAIGAASVAAAICFSALFAVSSANFFRHYFNRYPRYSSYDWNCGFKEAFSTAGKSASPGTQIVVSDSIPFSYIYALYYTKYDPARLQARPLEWKGPYRVGDFDQYSVRDPYLQHNNLKQLFITGKWERPDLPELPLDPRPTAPPFVKISVYEPQAPLKAR